MHDSNESFWGGDRVERLHPRLVAELLLDAERYHREPGALMNHLRKLDFAPDFVRSKGYIARPHAVAVIPWLSKDLTSVAGVGVRKNLFDPTEEATATGTIVKMAGGSEPLDFTLLTVDEKSDEINVHGPVDFDDLRRNGPDNILKKLAPDIADRDFRFEQLTRGRAIAAAAIEDLATEERDIGFISQSEFHQLVRNAEFYSDIARLHSYLSVATAAAGGCKGCTSTSSYVCTSTSCNITIGSLAANTAPSSRA